MIPHFGQFKSYKLELRVLKITFMHLLLLLGSFCLLFLSCNRQRKKEIIVSAVENSVLKTPDIVPFSVPVIWARILKDLDWVVPVRGRQSSVSSVMRFLLASA